MKNFKKIILTTSIITIGAISVVGASGLTEKIEAYLNPEIKITIDGEDYVARKDDGTVVSPIIYEDHIYLPARYIAEEAGMSVEWNEETQTVVLERNLQPESVIGTEGAITNISSVNGKTMVLVEGQNIGAKGYEKIKLMIDKQTQIINSVDGSKLSINDIKQGTKIKAYYGPKVTRSLPPIGTAEKIVVISETVEHNYPLVGKYMSKVNDKYIDVLGGDIMHRINIEKVKEALKNIPVDSNVEVETIFVKGEEVATHIKIYTEKNQVQSSEIEGTISKVNIDESNNLASIYITTEKSENNSFPDIILNIGEFTKLEREDGTQLTIDSLKEGIKIKAYYGPKVTMSIPPISNAVKIIIK